MFDKETEQFFHMLKSNTIGDASSIGLRSILESNIPVNVKTFFRADVEWLRAQEKLKEVRSPKFSFGLPEVRLLDEQIDLLLVNNYSFSRKEFDATADKCIHFLLNYLCRPEWTLNSFFFDVSIRITAEEMQLKLRYCSDYPYYRAILTRYAETRQRTDVGSEEMKRLLSTIDDEVCGSSTAAEQAYIAKPIFDFVGEIRASMRPSLPTRVPVRALIYFYEDKRLDKISTALTAVRDLDNTLLMSFPMLEMVIEAVARGAAVPDLSMLSAAGAQEPLPEPSSSRSYESLSSVNLPVATEAVREDLAAPRYDEIEAALPRAENEMMDDEAPVIMPPVEEDERVRTVTVTAARRDDEISHDHAPRQEQQFFGADGEHEEEQLHFDDDGEAPLEEETIVLPPQFTDNDRLAITQVLFQGSGDLFDAAVQTAVRAETWDEALTSLDSFFAKQYIDPFTKEAMMFTNILESWHRTFKK
jgi:hypothetical protein